jgi:drug/metabolite transporter (DMT)-like permease
VAKAALPSVNLFYLSSERYGLAALIFTAILFKVEGRSALRFDGHAARIFTLGAIGFGGFGILATLGLEHTRPQNAALLVGTMPLLTALVLWVRQGARPTWMTIGFMLTALLGVGLVITRGSLSMLVHGQIGGWDGVVLLGVLGWVIYTVGASSFPGWSPLRYTTLSALAGSATVIAITAIATIGGFVEAPSLRQTVGSGWEIAYLALPGTAIAVLAWNAGIKRLGAQNVVLFINLVPVITLVIEVARGYHVVGIEVGGVALTILAVLGNNLWQRWTASRSKRVEYAPDRVAA